MSKIRITFNVVVEYEVHPENYPGCTTDAERLAIDLGNAEDDPFAMLAASPQPQPVQPSEPNGINRERIDKHAIQAGDCPGHSWVVLRSSLYRMLDEVTQAKPEQAAQPTQAAIDVLAERQRQISAEGWTPEHDDEHTDDELSLAAASYAICNRAHMSPPGFWPWEKSVWKPSDDSRRNLIKAGALILAEIERLDRAAPQPKD